jgi:hypothetical protein
MDKLFSDRIKNIDGTCFCISDDEKDVVLFFFVAFYKYTFIKYRNSFFTQEIISVLCKVSLIMFIFIITRKIFEKIQRLHLTIVFFLVSFTEGF